jgi:drug/metabolite transporter (DMT)-like permease
MTWFSYAVLSAFIGSLSAMVEKKTLSHIHALDFSIVLSFAAAVCSLPFLLSADWSTLSPTILALAYAISLLAAFAFIGVTRGLRHLEISTSSSLFLLGPFITALLAYLLLGESLTYLQLCGIALLAVGIYVLETNHLLRFGEFWKNTTGDRYTRYILFGLFLYGFCGVGDRIMLGHFHVDAKFYTALVQLFLALQFLLISFYYRGGISEPLRAVGREWKMLILVAILTTLYRYMQAEATALAAVGLVVAVKRSSALFTTIVGGELFQEKNLFRKSIACLIMIGGVFLIALK